MLQLAVPANQLEASHGQVITMIKMVVKMIMMIKIIMIKMKNMMKLVMRSTKLAKNMFASAMEHNYH